VSVANWTLNDSPEMDEEQFNLWQALLEDRTGMQLALPRKRFLETSVWLRMREIGCENYDEYYEQLVAGLSGQVEWATLVDRLTVQETRFFRHLSSFDLVRDVCREKWAEQKDSSVEIWSVGCATGEEPYTLAMVLNELLGESTDKARFGITATDISLPALSKARKGIYGERRLEQVDPTIRDKYFHKVSDGRYQVVPQLKERVCFARINVLELSTVPFQDLDIIFCQNLLIYFKRWRKRDIVNALTERLKVGGLLVLGLGEVVDWDHPKIARVSYENTLAYTRIK